MLSLSLYFLQKDEPKVQQRRRRGDGIIKSFLSYLSLPLSTSSHYKDQCRFLTTTRTLYSGVDMCLGIAITLLLRLEKHGATVLKKFRLLFKSHLYNYPFSSFFRTVKNFTINLAVVSRSTHLYFLYS